MHGSEVLTAATATENGSKQPFCFYSVGLGNNKLCSASVKAHTQVAHLLNLVTLIVTT